MRWRDLRESKAPARTGDEESVKPTALAIKAKEAVASLEAVTRTPESSCFHKVSER